VKKFNPLITGTLLLTSAGLINKILGFIYRIYLSHLIGAEGMGMYQLIFPVFAICFSFCCAPIQTAISKFVAEESNPFTGIRYYQVGLALSLMLSCICAGFLYFFATPIATYFLLEPRCSNLLKILGLAIPCNSMHSCVFGYYYGKQKANIPASAQLIEQSCRMLFMYFLAVHYSQSSKEFWLESAVIALVIGEACSMIFSFIAIHIHFGKLHSTAKQSLSQPCRTQLCKNLLHMTCPLTANRLTLSFIQSIEATLIPAKLQQFGLSTSDAFSIYGIFSGMALPFIMTPSALTNSFSVMLLPDIAQAQAKEQYVHISYMSNKVRDYCLYLGILCTGIFLSMGNQLGTLFFSDTLAGKYICSLSWICPFLYLSTTLSSILHGLGETTKVFIYQLIGLSVQLLFVIAGIPSLGILGYFFGLLISQLTTCLLYYVRLKHFLALQMDAFYTLVRPITAIAVAITIQNLLIQHFSLINSPPILLGISCAIIIGIYFSILGFTHQIQVYFHVHLKNWQ
jgi:stage V sporulation protein B